MSDDTASDVADRIAERLAHLGFPIDLDHDGDDEVIEALNQSTLVRDDDPRLAFSAAELPILLRAAQCTFDDPTRFGEFADHTGLGDAGLLALVAKIQAQLSADSAPLFPFCKECSQNKNGEACAGCGAHVCDDCAHTQPNGDKLCDDCYEKWCDDERYRQATEAETDYQKGFGTDTPLAEQLDDHPVPGIDD